MPWEIRKQGNQFCVYKQGTDEKSGCHPSEAKAKKQLAALYAQEQMEQEQETLMLENSGFGPALTAVAATIKPHLRQRGNDITLTEIDGQEMVRIPIMRKGVYRHSSGKLVFNDKFFESMIKNHEDQITDYNVALDLRHKDTEGALAWLDKADGGFLKIEDNWLVGYGIPTDEHAKNLIKSKRYRYASAEFSRDYQSNQMARLSLDDMEEMSTDELANIYLAGGSVSGVSDVTNIIKFQEVDMEITVLEDGTANLTAEQVKEVQKFEDSIQALTADLDKAGKEAKKATDKITKLEKEQGDKIKQLEAKLAEYQEDDEPEVPEEIKVRLEALEKENTRLNQARMQEKVIFTLEKAEKARDEQGRGHSKVFLDLCRAGLMFKAFEQTEVGTVQLEEGDTDDPEKVRQYYRQLIALMLDKVPGQVKMESDTVPDEERTHLNGSDKFSLENIGNEEARKQYFETEFWAQN